MILKDINDIVIDDFQTLIDNCVAERKTIEYKLNIIIGNDKEKKEFLSDVSSFANASGVDLIIGISENRSTGLPEAVIGITIPNTDELIRKIENLIRDSIAPRIVGIQTKVYQLTNLNYILLIRIPKSWNSPHQIIYQGSDKFYSRATNGKYKLDVNELRNAFIFSDTITERVRKFRESRLSAIISDESPALLLNNAKIVLQFIPLSSFEPNKIYDISSSNIQATQIKPLGDGGWTPTFNIDGILCTSSLQTNGRAKAYIQLFRNGIIETVNSEILEPYNGEKLVPSVKGLDYETKIIQSVQSCINIVKVLKIEMPVYFYVTLIGVKDYRMESSRVRSIFNSITIDRETLALPELVVEKLELNIPQMLKPIFDMIWNACGYERSMNYDQSGNWMGVQ